MIFAGVTPRAARSSWRPDKGRESRPSNDSARPGTSKASSLHALSSTDVSMTNGSEIAPDGPLEGAGSDMKKPVQQVRGTCLKGFAGVVRHILLRAQTLRVRSFLSSASHGCAQSNIIASLSRIRPQYVSISFHSAWSWYCCLLADG